MPTLFQIQEQQRQAIIFHYMELKSPPESEWSRHGGTLQQIADRLGYADPCDYRPIKQCHTVCVSGKVSQILRALGTVHA